jgi:hypothetical protein
MGNRDSDTGLWLWLWHYSTIEKYGTASVAKFTSLPAAMAANPTRTTVFLLGTETKTKNFDIA